MKTKEEYNNRRIAKSNLRKYEDAISDYTEAIKLDPKDKDVYYNRGVAKNKLGNYTEAILDYNEVIKLDPKDKDAHYNKGNANINLGNYEDAILDYDQAIKLDPKYKDAYYNRGVAKSNLGNNNEAILDYDEVIKLDPKDKDAYYNKGVEKGNLGYYEDAILNYDEVLRLDSNYKSAYNNRGIAKSNLGNNNEAILDYDKAINLNPEYILAYYNRGNAQSNLNKHKIAILDYKKVINSDPKSEESTKIVKNILNNFEKNRFKKYFKEIITKTEIYSNWEIMEILECNIEKIEREIGGEIKKKIQNGVNKYFSEAIEKNKKDEVDKNKIYYMYKEINANLIKQLVNGGVYKNHMLNFNDPFDPYFKNQIKILTTQVQEIKMTCFTEEPNNLLLWSHYAKEHKGVCLGYRIKDKKEENIFFKKINYEGIRTKKRKNNNENRELVTENEITLSNDITNKIHAKNKIKQNEERHEIVDKEMPVEDLFFRKNKAWSYENEWRFLYLDREKNKDYCEMFELVEIIFGVHTQDSDKDLIQGIFLKNNENDNLKITTITEDDNLTLTVIEENKKTIGELRQNQNNEPNK